MEYNTESPKSSQKEQLLGCNVVQNKKEKKFLRKANKIVGTTSTRFCILESDADHTLEEYEAHKKLHIAADVIKAKFMLAWSEKLRNISANQQKGKGTDTRNAVTKLLGDITETCSNFGIIIPNDDEVADSVLPCYARICLGILPGVYLSLSHCCFAQKHYPDATAYANLGLDWSNHFRCRNELARPSVQSINLLLARAQGHRETKNFTAGIHDFDAAWAAARSHGEEFQNRNSYILLKALEIRAEQKLLEEATRPHYLPNERNIISRRLGVGIYSDPLQKCWNCNTLKSEQVALMLCSRCFLVWYCSKNCQKNHYQGHKSVCKAGKVGFCPLITSVLKNDLEQQTSNKGFTYLSNAMYGPLMIFRDPSSGALFDSLHDLDLVVDDNNLC